MLQTNQDAQSMEVLRTKETQSVTTVKTASLGSYETVNIGARKTWHGRPHVTDKRGRNKVGSYTSTYTPGADFNKTYQR